MTHEEFDGFTVTLHPDEEGDWIAHFLELPNVSAFATTPNEAVEELKEAWTLMKESYAKHNESVPLAPKRRDYSGQFNVRIDKRVHCALAVEAARAGISLNSLVSQKLAKSVDSDPCHVL